MSLLSFRSDFFQRACGPRPRDDAARRALESNEGDSFFAPLELEGETYAAWQRRRPQWEEVREVCLLTMPGVPSDWTQACCAYIEAFLPSVQCRPLRARSVENGMRFVPKQAIAGSCGEGGCRGEVQAIEAHAIINMVERMPEASAAGTSVIALTKEAMFTERDGVCEFAASSKSRVGVASLASITDVRSVARLVMRSLCQLIGFVECGWMRCVLNVLRSSEDTHLMVACPACLRRIGGLGAGRVASSSGGGFGGTAGGGFRGRESTSAPNFVLRYETLARWFTDHCGAGANEVGWIRERYFAITGRELMLDEMDRAISSTGAGSSRASTAAQTVQRVEGEGAASKEEIRSKLKLLKRKKKRR
jgi:hypothetical protein